MHTISAEEGSTHSFAPLRRGGGAASRAHRRSAARLVTYGVVAFAFLVIFIGSTSFRVRAYDDKSVDLQVLVKILSILVSGAVGAFLVFAVQRGRISGGALSWFGFLAALVLSALYAPVFGTSLAAAASGLACFLFCLWLVGSLGELGAAKLFISTFAAICLVSIALFYAAPEFARMYAWNAETHVFGPVDRMRGIGGSANEIGTSAACLFLLCIFYIRSVGSTAWRLLLAAAALVALAAVGLSGERMAIVGILCATVIRICMDRNVGLRFAALSAVLLGSIPFLALLADPLSDMLSRTDDGGITTGRTRIWSVVLEHIWERPFFGHGYSSSITLLPYDPRLFSVAAHAHNLYLEVLFSVGLAGFILLLIACFTALFVGVSQRRKVGVALLGFFLLRGMVEPQPMTGIIAGTGFFFYLSLALIFVRAPSPAGRPSASGTLRR